MSEPRLFGKPISRLLTGIPANINMNVRRITMNIVRANEGNSYMAPGHFGGEFISKQNDSAPGNKHLTLNLSHFQPGGGCEMGTIPEAAPMNLCYYVVKGQITVTTPDDKFTLYEGDSVLWAPGDTRGFVNEGDTVTDLLVMIAK